MKIRRGWKHGPAKKPAHAPPLTGMWALRERFLEDMQAKNYADDTVRMWAADLRRFLTWCDERSITEPTEVTQPIIERYQRWLYHYRQTNGQPISFPTQHHLLRTIKTFFRWLTRQRLTLFNPAAEIELPRLSRRLPRDVLSAAEAEAVLAQPDVETPLGLRDRAILETFYSTGIRRRELANLALYDLNWARHTLMVRQGKGRKDRVLPIGLRARNWIRRYLDDVRPTLAVEPDDGTLFLTVDGTSFSRGDHLSELVSVYVKAANIGKTASCHIFRHTMATLMLENGADVRFIQMMLGHANLATTEIYTHVSIGQLQQIHHATHPAEAANTGGSAAPAEEEEAPGDD